MRYLSVCSGIEAASVAWGPLGWTPLAFAEIEPFPSAVLAHHYPHVPNMGDMTSYQEWPDADVDVLVGGTPCQSFSVAGLRQGLRDPRGQLMLSYLGIADRYRPKWVVWENVPGVLSSHGGRDFGSFLGGLAQLGYGFSYRVLDAQFVRARRFGRAVPQRRRRVFVVGHLGGWRPAAAVLFDGESLRGNPPPRREAGQGFTRGIELGARGGGFADVSPTLDTGANDGPIRNQLAPAALVTNSGDGGLITMAHGQGNAEIGLDHGPTLTCIHEAPIVAHSLRGEGFDASEDGTGRGTPLVPVAIQERAVSENPNAGPGGTGVRQDGAAYTLEARHTSQAVAFDLRGREGGAMPEGPHDTANIRAASGGSSRSYVAVAFDANAGGDTALAMGDVPGALHGVGRAAVAFAENGRAELSLCGGDGQVMSPLTTGGGKPGQGRPTIALPWAVRRLTPRECERLQGFPDDYTLIPTERRNPRAEDDLAYLREQRPGLPDDDLRRLAADGPRYKALGNSMAVNVMEWIGERIMMVERGEWK